MTEEQKARLLGKQVEKKLYYRMDDYGYETISKGRVLSGFNQLDYYTKGFEFGGITIWTGLTNAGKTTVMTTIAKNIIMQGERIFFFNGEQTKEDFKNNLYLLMAKQNELKKVQFKNSNVYDTYIKKEQANKLEKVLGNKIFVYNNEERRNIDVLLYAMEEVRRIEKVKVFFLDNFMQIETNTNDEYREQKDIMEKLRTFAVNKKVHIHLVAHPRKIERFQARLSLYDIAGSSNLVNKAYNVISILRVDNLRDDKEKEKLRKELEQQGYVLEYANTVLEVLKQKGNQNGFVALKYNKENKSFEEIERLPIETVESINKNNMKEGELPW